ncbi:hypothetical protein BKP35_11300 [Anaerobacillus arseniciselenatis]|uniref:DUF1878 domain-containing protein n=1 Tax=Anaerobacillus arseniciselenatis TaxID=85682 RepID=A0A1S2LJK6_9BACI|nr:DUF1878 family protein [Anaerobacillus arseniciselenatis]OIJ11877.1 hypothetical protein BKP35_11300 [Anaerobacillus arseniciselenatis]
METNEEKLLRLEFYQELLLSLTNGAFPFYTMVVNEKLSRNEVQEVLELCEKLNDEYEKQKEEGFITFLPLLTHFVGMLNYKLDPHKTIDALHKQGIYRNLMSEFLKTIKNH